MGAQGMNWVPLKSRMLGAVAYSDAWQQLYLRFRSDDVYCYRGVPVERYQELLAADSKGKYARSYIFNRYPHQRIRAAVRNAS
jgi:hypothetical protein